MGCFIATNGELGACTEEYTLIQTAKYLNVPPWDLMKQSIFWRNAAIRCMQAEESARKTLEARRK